MFVGNVGWLSVCCSGGWFACVPGGLSLWYGFGLRGWIGLWSPLVTIGLRGHTRWNQLLRRPGLDRKIAHCVWRLAQSIIGRCASTFPLPALNLKEVAVRSM